VKGFQVVVGQEMPEFDFLTNQSIGACVSVKGVIIKSPATGQLIEMQVKDKEFHHVKVVGSCNPSEYKLFKGKEQIKLENLRDLGHLRARTNVIACVARVRNSLAFATHDFFQKRGFLYIHTPIITASDCEGAGEMFQVTTLLPKEKEIPKLPLDKEGHIDYKDDFFGKAAFLTVSGQLAVENYACALSDVYTFGPTFRAERSHTTRHLSEFWMIEPEMCFADIYDDMEVAEHYLKYCLNYVLENNIDDLNFLEKLVEPGLIDRLKNVIHNEFKKLPYTEAIKEVEEAYSKDNKLFEVKPYWGLDMGSEHERYLTDKVYKKPIIVYNYPKKDIKAFYMRQNEDGKTVAAMDILVPKIGEIIGGSQREERYEVLVNRIKEMKMPLESYWWYLELRKFGTVPHCGFGLGFERLVMMATGMENIRDVIPYPRYPGHSEF